MENMYNLDISFKFIEHAIISVCYLFIYMSIPILYIMNIIITGGTANITDVTGFLNQLTNLGSKYNITIQALNADLISGSRHLQSAVNKTLRSFSSLNNAANDPGMEIMMYASGRRQIERALALGIKKGKMRIAIVLIGENAVDEAAVEVEALLDTIDPGVIDYSDIKREEIMDFFDITTDEINAVGKEKIPELVLERVALIDVFK